LIVLTTSKNSIASLIVAVTLEEENARAEPGSKIVWNLPRHLLTIILMWMLGAASPSLAQTQAACSTSEHRALDFWVGEWDVSWEGGQGSNSITKILSGCAVEENFQGGPSTNNLIGRSISTYSNGQWRQTWVDNQNGYFTLSGGVEDDGFVLTATSPHRDGMLRRMVFEDIEQDSFVWRWQRRSGPDAPWSDAWVIRYRRRST
jgi:hypothetical protein